MFNNHKVLLCAATEQELFGLSECPCCETFITGVGTFQTVHNLTRKLCEEDYKMVIGAGIAGSYHIETPIGELCTVSHSTFVDSGIEYRDGTFCSLIGSKFLSKNMQPFVDGYIESEISKELAKLLNIRTVRANTVSKISSSSDNLRKLLTDFPADIETMESAAMAYVCGKMSIKYTELRCISNHTIPKKDEKWEIDKAVNKLVDTLNKILSDDCKILERFLR